MLSSPTHNRCQRSSDRGVTAWLDAQTPAMRAGFFGEPFAGMPVFWPVFAEPTASGRTESDGRNFPPLAPGRCLLGGHEDRLVSKVNKSRKGTDHRWILWKIVLTLAGGNLEWPRFGGVVAQLVERLNGIQEVRGSNPLGSTTQCLRHDRTEFNPPSPYSSLPDGAFLGMLSEPENRSGTE